jgi:hypothetical protein
MTQAANTYFSIRLQAAIGLMLVLIAALAFSPALPHAQAQEVKEIHSNGVGGGEWSDPNTWRGNIVPSAKDDVTITAGDLVIFDKDHSDTITCGNIYIDPRSVLAFKNSLGPKVMSIAGSIESYGAIRMGIGASRVDPDTNGNPRDIQQIRLVAPTAENRVIRLVQNGSILVYGARSRIDNKPNVSIVSGPVTPDAAPIHGTIRAARSNMVDIQRAGLQNIVVMASGIDNTGSKANERFNITSCNFTGLSRIQIDSCDTPVIGNNDFLAGEGVTVPASAIMVSSSPLADIRGNVIKGSYPMGIQGVSQPDSTCMNNTITGTTSAGIYWHGTNAILKNNNIFNCPTAISFATTTGVIEESRLVGAKVGIYATNSTFQATNVVFEDLEKETGKAISISSATGFFLNCNLTPEMIHVWGGNPEVPVFVRDFLIVQVSWPGQKEGKPAPGSDGREVWVEVHTNNPRTPIPPGAMDPNVIGSPVKLNPRTGMTPLPHTLESLVINSWGMTRAGKVMDPLEYKIRVGVAPDADDKSNDTMKVLRELIVKPQPDWYRGIKDNGKPTVEVELK